MVVLASHLLALVCRSVGGVTHIADSVDSRPY
jgi:hypothetical protein